MRALGALLLVAIGGGFALLAAAGWMAPEAPPEPSRRPGPAPGEALGPPAHALGTPAPTDLAPFTERPLFSAARRPPPPEAPGAPLEDPYADLLFGRYEVTGVVLLETGALAMLRDAKAGRLIRLRTGDSLEAAGAPAELTGVSLRRLTFRHEGATVTAPVRGKGESAE